MNIEAWAEYVGAEPDEALRKHDRVREVSCRILGITAEEYDVQFERMTIVDVLTSALICGVPAPECPSLPERCPACLQELVFDIQDSDPPSVTTKCACGEWGLQAEQLP